MILIRAFIRLLVRFKGRAWLALTALRIYRRLPGFAQRRVRKRALRALPQVARKRLSKGRAGRR